MLLLHFLSYRRCCCTRSASNNLQAVVFDIFLFIFHSFCHVLFFATFRVFFAVHFICYFRSLGVLSFSQKKKQLFTLKNGGIKAVISRFPRKVVPFCLHAHPPRFVISKRSRLLGQNADTENRTPKYEDGAPLQRVSHRLGGLKRAVLPRKRATVPSPSKRISEPQQS